MNPLAPLLLLGGPAIEQPAVLRPLALAAAATSPSLHLRQILSDLAEERLDPPTADESRRDRIREAMDRLANRPARRPPP